MKTQILQRNSIFFSQGSLHEEFWRYQFNFAFELEQVSHGKHLCLIFYCGKGQHESLVISVTFRFEIILYLFSLETGWIFLNDGGDTDVLTLTVDMYVNPLGSFESLSCRFQICYLMMNCSSSIAFVPIMEPLSNHHCSVFHTLLELMY